MEKKRKGEGRRKNEQGRGKRNTIEMIRRGNFKNIEAYLREGCLGAEANIVAWGQICWRKMKKRFEKTWAAIQKQRTKRGSSQIVFIGATFADVVILALGVVLGGGRQREEKTNEENTVYRFLPTLQNTQRE